MNALAARIAVYAVFVGATNVVISDTTLTFDDLSPGLDYAIVETGYGGLRWNNFGVLNGSLRPVTEGYRTGMVSSNNVVFNLGGNPASIAGGKLFDLHAGYLTAAFVNGVQIRVQGFSGPTLAYDNTYTANTKAPALINFNYLGVDLVKFIPSPDSPFVMDNLTVTLTDALPPRSAVDVDPVQVTRVGHSFFVLPCELARAPRSTVRDVLIDQSQNSGGVGVLPSVSSNFDTNNQFVLTISAPPGQKFLIKVPPREAVRFGGSLLWESTRAGESPPGPVAVSFGGLEGTPPDCSQSDSVLSDSHGFFGFVDISSSPFTNDLAFTTMTITGTVVAQYTGFGTLNFVPHHDSSLSLSYTTSETNDPGSFVSIVPVSAPPRIRLLPLSPGSGTVLFVHGQAGRTNVVEASTDLVDWTAVSTNVMPFTVCPSCPYVYVTDPEGTNSVRRFYRVFERP